jgi:hypothetical protein
MDRNRFGRRQSHSHLWSEGLNARNLSLLLPDSSLIPFSERCIETHACPVRVAPCLQLSRYFELTSARPEAYLHAILSTRMILRLRQWSERAYGQGSRDAGDAGTWVVAGLDYYSQSTELSKNFSSPRSFPSANQAGQSDSYYSGRTRGTKAFS